jgi:hypothetical protein
MKLGLLGGETCRKFQVRISIQAYTQVSQARQSTHNCTALRLWVSAYTRVGPIGLFQRSPTLSVSKQHSTGSLCLCTHQGATRVRRSRPLFELQMPASIISSSAHAQYARPFAQCPWVTPCASDARMPPCPRCSTMPACPRRSTFPHVPHTRDPLAWRSCVQAREISRDQLVTEVFSMITSG